MSLQPNPFLAFVAVAGPMTASQEWSDKPLPSLKAIRTSVSLPMTTGQILSLPMTVLTLWERGSEKDTAFSLFPVFAVFSWTKRCP